MKKGFTLIELMIVIAIIAVLASIIIPNFVHARAQGNLSECQSNLRNLSAALEIYSVENGGHFPDDLSDLTQEGKQYISKLPACSSTGTQTYTYESRISPDCYTIVCSGSNHLNAQVPANYPQYNYRCGIVTRP